jgi:DNA mismatch repair protein MutH
MGKTLGQLAAIVGWSVPPDLRRHKGWVGELLETCLGAEAGNQAKPDFIGIGVEMKTLPLNAQGQPKESTYVCTVSLQQTGELTWQESWVREKLSNVLWVPVEADNEIALAERYVGKAWIWQPSAQQEAILQQDWQELMDCIVLGEQDSLTAHMGQYLQIRPKAAHSRIRATGISDAGEHTRTNPKGFYLRASFTRQILAAG